VIGQTVSHYRIIEKLGAGGMGEVYRARDERLGRDVAVKLLSAELAADAEQRRRFEQEVRAAAALNHPGILAVHDVGDHEGRPYLVTELLEGTTLRERLAAGKIPPKKAAGWGVEIAAALAAAHEHRIIHRDLKPENLFVTTEGRMKILDFGLAKVASPPPVGDDTESVRPRAGTDPGTVLGTAGYMAPEQVRGEAVDHRADIFALGCVLYEMLSGSRAFHRDTAVETLNAILKEEPPELAALDPAIPAGLVKLVEHCLEKHPADRFQSARDLAFHLKALAAPSGSTGPQGAALPGRRRRWLPLAAGLGLLLVLGAGGAFLVGRWVGLRSTPTPPAHLPVRFAVPAPEGGTLVTDVTAAAISPDGQRLVFTVMDAAGTMRLWVRPLKSLDAQPLSGTEGATCPFWSPDSRSVAFFAQGKLFKVPVSGGPPEAICDAPDGRGGTWSRDGGIVYAPVAMGSLWKIPAEGGEPVEVAKPDPARGDTALRFPSFLPDGRHFLYVSLPRKDGRFDVHLGALDSKESRRIASASSAPVYAEPGYLLFTLGDRLVAQRFDRSGLQPVGTVMPFGGSPPQSVFDGAAALSASEQGVLAHPAATPPRTELVWLDRAGRQTGKIPMPPGSYSYPSLSPDGRWATVAKFNSPTSYDLWLVDLRRSVTTRLTFDGRVAAGGGGLNAPIVWSPDIARIAYMYDQNGRYAVYTVPVSGGGQPEPLVESDALFTFPAAWSPDGKYFVFSQSGEGSQYDLWLRPMQGDRTPVPFLRTPFSEDAASISPDGRWLAYDSDETGAPEIYVRSFPNPGEKIRVSTAGGTIAQWSRDGKELLMYSLSLYFYGGGPIYIVDVETAPTFKAHPPRVLFVPPPSLNGLAALDDLSRFLVTIPAEGAAPPGITVTLNWPALLRQ